MLIKLQLLNYYSQNNSHHLVLMMKILIKKDLNNKLDKYFKILVLDLKIIYSMPYLKDQKLLKAPYWKKLVVTHLKLLYMICRLQLSDDLIVH
jgi:hypothetical protein